MFTDKDGIEGCAAELQKEHYKTDWHRYNLKRKVADLPPVTAENFQQRVLAQKEQVAEQAVDKSCACQTCGKHFNTVNAYNNHLKSKKHRETATRDECLMPDVQQANTKNERRRKDATYSSNQLQCSSEATSSSGELGASGGVEEKHQLQKDIDMESDADSDEAWSGEALGFEECLFCPHVSDTLEKNIEHMTVEHSFFIPDVEYLVNLEGFISYLGQKVGELHMCLWCGDKSKVYLETKAVQQHMCDKGHCKLFHDGDAFLEYAEFFDYRKSYPDYKEGDDADESVEMVDANADGSSLSEVDESGYQLVLPSGATVGHRALMRYYRQKLKPDRQIAIKQNTSAVSKVISHYKALGWTGTTGAAAATKAKDIAYVQRLRSRQWTRLGVKGNQLQKHFRDQLTGR